MNRANSDSLFYWLLFRELSVKCHTLKISFFYPFYIYVSRKMHSVFLIRSLKSFLTLSVETEEAPLPSSQVLVCLLTP